MFISINKSCLFFIFLFIPLFIFSQEIKIGDAYDYARKIVDTMASKSMHGRGYVKGGDSIAANYIKTEFTKFELKSFGSDYYQSFTFPVNTFPGIMKFGFIPDRYAKLSPEKVPPAYRFDGIPAVNFLIDPSSSLMGGWFDLLIFDSTNAGSHKGFKKFKKQIQSPPNTIILVDDRNVVDKKKLEYFKKVKSNCFETRGVVEFVKKLTWDQSQKTLETFKIQIYSESLKTDTGHYHAIIGIENKFLPAHPSQNVIGYIKGSEHPDSFIVFTAHYDHLGQMGKDVYFPGANDNASGCAMLLNLARYYSKPEHQPKCSVAFIAFCGEEVGLLGSKYYTEHPLFPLKQIKFLLNMDIMGTGEEGITMVNGSIYKKEFEKLKQINAENNFIKDVKIRGKAANSDHYWFSEKGIRAGFIYTMGGIKAYHDIYDRAETLPLNEFQNLFLLIIKFGEYLNE